MFLVAAVLIGPFVVLVDIRKSIKALETKSIGGGSGGVLPTEVKEPSL
jgi:hypothetical protein